MKSKSVTTHAKTVGFVFPIYLTTLPKPVREFLRKIDLQSADYIFSVGTREGTFSFPEANVNYELKKKGKQLSASFLVNMIQNTPTGLKPGPADKNWLEKISPANVDRIMKSIAVQIYLTILQGLFFIKLPKI
ncbi:MAG: hypothetical protein A2015_05100 [Spirochaetes bacterium GWF1_31_7]|nr:MAG: hypothetical protein A2Y30_06500 [Spirochaetes bacterium GWE1_32_154]OHD47221.1 MAG: hypothetical protein A2015_05100 [Spirochaetes bacterium GWF1_31_7]OHD52635.1 MAG: hypothetical protein A2Y29_09665 [Spirochaetes bacterium GWE2_31_10]OHD73248.1 MAG: hypothetical protein A2355_16895 [Spirochaetes bacterium RIFOXYB1_FULL_32_8]HBD94300.1 hypothetical protein [Spirochaetia bacterium]